MRGNLTSWIFYGAIGFACIVCLGQASRAADAAKKVAADGHELFVREWIPGDARSPGGDGLGPVFNDTSCVACHNQGGVGGAGPAGKNAELITAFANSPQAPMQHRVSLLGTIVRSLTGAGQVAVAPDEDNSPQKNKGLARRQREQLSKIHPGFRTAGSVVLHRFGTPADYAGWRNMMTGMQPFMGMGGTMGTVDLETGVGSADQHSAQLAANAQQEISRLRTEAQFGASTSFFGPASVDNFVFVRSQRNTIALFGAGVLDSVPAKTLEAAAAKTYKEFPQISGRAARLKDGTIGRFGWKAQKASLEDFVLTACAVELGLHVPGHPQSGNPKQPDYTAPGLDLNKGQCDALVAYIRNLPAPVEMVATTEKQRQMIAAGRRQFENVGCATCHTPDLGEARGLYSDLLLHDMGPELADTGSYGSFVPNSAEEDLDDPLPVFGGNEFTQVSLPQPQIGDHQHQHQPQQQQDVVGALRHEWRTPPLWGVRDSAPYLHDGRAATLEQAIAFHGGEATSVTQKYFQLSPEQRTQVLTFLRSLVAPQ